MKLGHLRVNEVGKILVAELHRLVVCPGLKDDLLVSRENPIHVHLQAIEVPKGGTAPSSQSGNNPPASSSVASLTCGV